MAYLEAEGVDAVGSGSLLYKDAVYIARQLIETFGEAKARRHPLIKEICGKDTRRWWTIAAAADGILFPATSYEGLVLGIQIRKDRPRGKDDRYRWLSHDNLGGTPLTVFRAVEGAENPHHLIITEGYKKAAVAARTLQCHALSLAGVTAYKDSELIKTVEALGVHNISLAFDQDKREKKQVKEAEQRLLRVLAAALPQLELYYLNWDSRPERVQQPAKGLDDAVKAGSDFRFEEAAPQAGPRLVTDLPVEALARAFPTLHPTSALQEAREAHSTIMHQIVNHPDGKKMIIPSTTGTSKSQASDDAIADRAFLGGFSHRILLMCPNKANIAERTAPDQKLGQALAHGLIQIQRGWQLIFLEDNKPRRPQPEDCANPQAFEAGKVRHATAKFVCKDCVFGSSANWEAKFPGQPRSFKCEEEDYLATRHKSRKAQIVVATKDAYLNNSQELGQFDLIICDEELLPDLLESGIMVSTGVLAGWREKIALKGIEAPGWQKLVEYGREMAL
jgi:hypothetical protein